MNDKTLSQARLTGLSWPLSSLEEALDLLARRWSRERAGRGRSAALLDSDPDDPYPFGQAIERVLVPSGLEVQSYVVRYGEVDRLPAPLVLRLPEGSDRDPEPVFLVIAQRHGQRATLLGRDHRWHRVDMDAIAAVLRTAVDGIARTEVEGLLDAASIPPTRRDRARRALLDDQLADTRVSDAWHVVVEPGSDFLGQLRHAGVVTQATGLVALHAIQFGLWILSWALIGRGALEGRIDPGWLTAWVLLLCTIVPLQAATTWMQGAVALGIGRLLKARLLTGALRMDPEHVRHQGAGQLLGRVLESDAVESLAVGGGLQTALAAVELVLSAGVLWFGATGKVHVLLLVSLLAVAAGGVTMYHRRRRRWAESRLAMTNELVESIAGHRTRLAQEVSEHWHTDEDRRLDHYLETSSMLDRWLPVLLVGLPRGWLAVAIGALGAAFVTGTSSDLLAVSIGGILLAALALQRFSDGLSQLSGAAIAWREAQPLFTAASDRPSVSTAMEGASSATAPAATGLEVRDVSFRYPTRPAAVLRGCTLQARPGDRLLLEGHSGGGKSTLASLIAGWRSASSGLILVNGLDQSTVGSSGWRRRVVAAPQFHENHVFCETFAFNLLMGRRWPPTNEDLADAEALARELGLGDLLARMPAGLMQLVGEGGWQLSHGERSRLFMARALLQGGDVMILDESFAALDPENLRDTLECVLRRAPTLLLIAHP